MIVCKGECLGDDGFVRPENHSTSQQLFSGAAGLSILWLRRVLPDAVHRWQKLTDQRPTDIWYFTRNEIQRSEALLLRGIRVRVPWQKDLYQRIYRPVRESTARIYHC